MPYQQDGDSKSYFNDIEAAVTVGMHCKDRWEITPIRVLCFSFLFACPYSYMRDERSMATPTSCHTDMIQKMLAYGKIRVSVNDIGVMAPYRKQVR